MSSDLPCLRSAPRAIRFGGALVLLLLAAGLPAQGKVFLSTAEALELAFPKCKVERASRVLDEAAKRRVEELSGAPPRRAMVFAYEARRDGELVGTAYFDRHRVRSMHEVLMVVVSPEGEVARVEVIAFGEPLDYIPRDNFYAQFVGRPLDAELSTKRAIRSVAGATLTVQATLDAVRSLLATHYVLYPDQVPRPPEPEPEPAPKPAPRPKPDK